MLKLYNIYHDNNGRVRDNAYIYKKEGDGGEKLLIDREYGGRGGKGFLSKGVSCSFCKSGLTLAFLTSRMVMELISGPPEDLLHGPFPGWDPERTKDECHEESAGMRRLQ